MFWILSFLCVWNLSFLKNGIRIPCQTQFCAIAMPCSAALIFHPPPHCTLLPLPGYITLWRTVDQIIRLCMACVHANIQPSMFVLGCLRLWKLQSEIFRVGKLAGHLTLVATVQSMYPTFTRPPYLINMNDGHNFWNLANVCMYDIPKF